MTDYEIRELFLAHMLSLYGGGGGRVHYYGADHRLIFWQLVALSEGVYRG